MLLNAGTMQKTRKTDKSQKKSQTPGMILKYDKKISNLHTLLENSNPCKNAWAEYDNIHPSQKNLCLIDLFG